MSELPASALCYETVVSEYFLGLRGAGLMLSPLDLELVRSWELRGVPVPVVCRGLRRGLEDALRDRPGSPPPRALRAYRLCVEDEWRAYRTQRVGESPAPPDETAVAERRLAAARALLARALPEGPLAAAHRAAARALASSRADNLAAVEVALAQADAELLGGWLTTLPRSARAALGRRCRLLAGNRPAWTRREAHRATLRAHLLDAAREAGLLCLRGSV